MTINLLVTQITKNIRPQIYSHNLFSAKLSLQYYAQNSEYKLTKAKKSYLSKNLEKKVIERLSLIKRIVITLHSNN